MTTSALENDQHIPITRTIPSNQRKYYDPIAQCRAKIKSATAELGHVKLKLRDKDYEGQSRRAWTAYMAQLKDIIQRAEAKLEGAKKERNHVRPS